MALAKSYKEHRQLAGGEEMVTLEFDFAKDGGAVASYDLLKVKEATVLVDAWVEILTNFATSASGTVQVGVTGNTDAIMAVTAAADADAGQVYTDADAVKKAMAADDKVMLEIATGAITAGRCRVVLKLKKLA
jgi:hypothetical protein